MKLFPIITRSVSFLMGRPGPYFLSMEVTMRCNCRCSFCNVWRTTHSLEDIVVENHAEKIMKKRLEEAWEMGCRAVCFDGGEPLLYKNLERLVSKANALGYYVILITNGINLTRPALWMKKIDALAMSFTMDRETYENSRGIPVFNLVKENIEKSVDYGLNIILFDALSRDTLPHLDETAMFARELGIKLHIFSVTEQPRLGYEEIDWSEHRSDNVYPEMERAKREWGRTIIFWRDGEAMLAGYGLNEGFRCRVAETTVIVKPNGSVVLPCSAFPEYRSRPNESLAEFWNSIYGISARKNCGRFKFCEECAHQFCNYHLSLIGQPRRALRGLFENI